MRKILIAAVVLTALPWIAHAQVEKQVEVTKAYVPSLEAAVKLSVRPDMTDTTKLRPEIDYTITPLSLQTTLTTRPIRPAKVTYWEFNRPLPYYLKVGAGYPLNSVLDLYASTQNPGTGYAVGYINHEGRYADIRNTYGAKYNSMQMTNRIGAAAGKYFGRRTLEGDLRYENRLYHRYGAYQTEGVELAGRVAPGAAVNYGDANVALRFGDDFHDLSRVNFELAIRGGMFFDHSTAFEYLSRARQTTLGASFKLARGFGKHRLSFDAGYERLVGQKAISDYREQFIRAGLRYGCRGGVVDFEVGADYVYDHHVSLQAQSYVLPFARVELNLGIPGLKPFVEVDGQVGENSYRSLTIQNPYVQNPFSPLLKSSVDYNGRAGISGGLWQDRLTYRLYAGFSIRDHHLYWLGHFWPTSNGTDAAQLATSDPGLFTPVQGRQTVTSFCGEVAWRPVSPLLVTLDAGGYLYHDEAKFGNGAPAFKGNVGIRYEGGKFSIGVKAAIESPRSWSRISYDAAAENNLTSFEAPFAVDLRAEVVWKLSGSVSLFAEGRNLANRVLYLYPLYPEYGANFTAGIKANF